MVEPQPLPIVAGVRQIVARCLALPNNLAPVMQNRQPVNLAALLKGAAAVNRVDKLHFGVHGCIVAVGNLAVCLAVRAKYAKHLRRHPLVQLRPRDRRCILPGEVRAVCACLAPVMHSRANAQGFARLRQFQAEDVVIVVTAGAAQGARHAACCKC